MGRQCFPLSLIDICKTIENLLLSGAFYVEGRVYSSTPSQLKSLTLLDSDCLNSEPLLVSVKPHINELRLLKFELWSVKALSELLGVCSQTLNKLDIDLAHTPCKVQVFF